MTAASRHKLLLVLLWLFLGADLLWSAYHYYNLPFDGDLTKIGGPFRWYEAVMQDPFGVQAVRGASRYSGAGRYMCHAWTVFWCHDVHAFLHSFIKDPVVCIYVLTCGAAMMVHLLFLLVVYLYARVSTSLSAVKTLFVLCFATVFIQYGSFYHSIGIIDRSPSYIFFYGLQLLLFALYLLPFFRAYQKQELGFSLVQHVLLTLGAVYLAFSSVLTQPVFFVLCSLAGIFYVLSGSGSRWRTFLFQKGILWQVCWMLLLCLYAFYVSKFNTENTQYTTLWERYRLLGKGVYYLFTYDYALLWMSALSLLNGFLVFRFAEENKRKTLAGMALAVLLFGILYTGLLPLGGYRAYRPYIVRYDTFMPVTFAWIFALTVSSVYLLKQLSSRGLHGAYAGSLALFMLLFTWYDRDLEKDANACQQDVLYYLHQQTGRLIDMPRHCNVGTWQTSDYDDPAVMDVLNKLYKTWGIIGANQTLVVKNKNNK